MRVKIPVMTKCNMIKLLLCVVFALLVENKSVAGVFSSLQPDTLHCFVFHFRFDKFALDDAYMENTAVLNELNRILGNEQVLMHVDSIRITATSSPEGNEAYNLRLARKRAKTMKSYISRKYPAVNENRIHISVLDEDWVGLRRMVEADLNVPYRDKVLETASREITSKSKERNLKQIGNGAAWRYLRKHILPYLRSGVACVLFYEKQKTELLQDKSPITKIVAATDIQNAMLPEIFCDTIPVAGYSLKNPDNKNSIAVKSNLLELAAGVANAGAEFCLGKKLSLDIPFDYSPYTIARNYRLRTMALRPELRYWFAGVFHGHFVGVHAIGGIYNVSVNSKTRSQSNRMAYGAGVSYGYALPLADRWGMEFSVGAGYVNTAYDCYYNVPDGMLFDSRKKHYWGITKASVGIVYLINCKK